MPERAVLIGEQHQLAALVHPRVAARMVQEHQRQQAAHLALVGHQRAEQPPQPDRLVAQLAPHHGVGLGRQVALVEDQVEHGQQRAQPVGQLVVGRHPVGDAGLADLALCAHDPLLHRGLAGQERARHLGRRQPAQRAQGQRHTRLRGERRVAAGEEQPQAIVGQGCVDRVVRLSRHQPLQLFQLVLVAALAAQAIDRPVASRADDPGAGVVRQPVARPALECDYERLLDRFLGEVEVAEDADQGRHRPA